MNNEPYSPPPSAPSEAPPAPPAAELAPESQEQVMQAAAARIAELEAQTAELKDRWMRAEAENANVRARAQREVDEARQYAVQKFAADVVEAADNLRRGIDSLPPPAEDQPEIIARLREGLDGVERSFIAILERNGIKREDPTGAAVRPQPASGHGRAGERSAPSRHGDPGMDPGLDPERPAAAPGDGGGGQGAARRITVGAVQAGHHRLMQPCRD